jgi:hypothetical protein
MSQEKYIGMDVHQATISVAVLDSRGKLIMESILETKAATILEFLQGLHGSLSVTFEGGTSAAWLHNLLKPHVTRLVVCDPRKNALLKDGSESDRIDARKLAELLRGNQLTSVYHGEHGMRTLKELGRSYATITTDRTRVMSRIKALYRSWAIACSGTSVYAPRDRDVTTAMTILSEAGSDMSKWKTESHFVSWLRLCPDNRISGATIIGKGRLPTRNRASIALRMAASTLRLSNTYLGAQFRRLRTRLGAPVAIKAMAAKLARLVYRMLRYGMRFVDQGAEFYETQNRIRQISYLKSKATKLGLQIIEAPAA